MHRCPFCGDSCDCGGDATDCVHCVEIGDNFGNPDDFEEVDGRELDIVELADEEA